MKKLAVIGASYFQLPLVKKAQSMDLEVHCFAWEDGAVCKKYSDYFYPISTVEKELILKKCQEIHIDGIITIASDVAIGTVNYVASKLGLIANDDKYTAMCTNKYLMREQFRKHSIPSPKYIIASENAVNMDLQYPLIVKPTDRSGSRGVQKIQSKEELKKSILRAQEESFKKEVIIEEFVEGDEISVEAISFKGEHYILQITDKVTTGAPYFVELEHHQPSSISSKYKVKIVKIVKKALTALHIEYGASHSELKITPNGEIKVIEIGARMGGDFIGSHLVYLSTGYDFLKGVIEVSLGNFEKPEIKFNKYSGVYFLSKETKHLEKIIDKSYNYPEIIEAKITNKILRNIECSGDRSGYLIYKADKKIFF